jgi:hypothetical protein
MKIKLHIAGLIVALVTLTGCNLFSAESVVTPAMAGHWEGNARIIVSWCRQTNLFVAIDVQTNGIVAGKIGDATLVDGHFQSRRSWPWRHTMVTGKLDGAIVAAEGITRSHLKMICDFSNDSYTGQIDTNGSFCVFSSEKTRKEKMALTAMGLKLTRPIPSP